MMNAVASSVKVIVKTMNSGPMKASRSSVLRQGPAVRGVLLSLHGSLLFSSPLLSLFLSLSVFLFFFSLSFLFVVVHTVCAS